MTDRAVYLVRDADGRLRDLCLAKKHAKVSKATLWMVEGVKATIQEVPESEARALFGEGRDD